MSQEELRSLPLMEPDGELVARVRRRAHREQTAGGACLATRFVARAAVTAALAFFVIAYLHWAIAAATTLYR